MKILTVNNRAEEKFLRTPAAPFVFSSMSARELNQTLSEMRRLMRFASGVGLAAVQIGIPFRFFIAELPSGRGRPKFYTLFNPVIKKLSGKTAVETEGCLSIPNLFGDVSRDIKITLAAQDKNGRAVKIKTVGFLARIFQHELDHLDGILFTDRASRVYSLKDIKDSSPLVG